MNITTLINNLRDALTASSAINAWCRSIYGKGHTVYKGVDQRNPPAEAEYPMVCLFPLVKDAGQSLEAQDHGIGCVCGVHDSTRSSSTSVIEDSIRSAAYKWTASGSGTSEYYCELAAGGDPSLNEPDGVKVNDVAATEGEAGSLAAGRWAWGDNDALGYSTVYVRLADGTDPDTKAAGYVEATYNVTLVEYAGIDRVEAFRKLVETAIVGAVSSPRFVEEIRVEFEAVEFFPYFLANMEVRVSDRYYGGDDAFK